MFKEFGLVCFDAAYARAGGWPVVTLDVVMMAMVVTVTVIGLQAVGLILIVALLIIPPAAARFWTDHLLKMVIVSAAIGAASGLFGSGLSALVPRLPAGAIIVTVAAAFFVLSMVFGPARGVLVRVVQQRRLSRKVRRQHLLRAMYEANEDAVASSVTWDVLLAARSWSAARLRWLLRVAFRQGLICEATPRHYRLTEVGQAEAARVMRNHRMWEIYLITHADIAPSHVDRDADQIEHVLGTTMVSKLDALLRDRYPHMAIPPSPHLIAAPAAGPHHAGANT
jgi:manganese/zinc/iron transport system permease protein